MNWNKIIMGLVLFVLMIANPGYFITVTLLISGLLLSLLIVRKLLKSYLNTSKAEDLGEVTRHFLKFFTLVVLFTIAFDAVFNLFPPIFKYSIRQVITGGVVILFTNRVLKVLKSKLEDLKGLEECFVKFTHAVYFITPFLILFQLFNNPSVFTELSDEIVFILMQVLALSLVEYVTPERFLE